MVKPEIAPSLLSQIDSIEKPQQNQSVESTEIALGTNCKNGGCTTLYQGLSFDEWGLSCSNRSDFIGEESNLGVCLHHPGVPIFHEGLKFWSCCQRKTTDFNSFLNQEGCKEGKHVWKKDGVSFITSLKTVCL